VSDGPLVVRRATPDDAPLLGALNEQLIVDEGAATSERGAELVARMRGFLEGGYSAAFVERDGEVVAYALWRPDGEGVHVRQFFVVREHRRAGVGRRAFALLTEVLWPDVPLALDVLVTNERGVGFWRSLGFADHTLAMRRPPLRG
jgi:ribosomal protein S18 acetylase RimI-like enzyme